MTQSAGATEETPATAVFVGGRPPSDTARQQQAIPPLPLGEGRDMSDTARHQHVGPPASDFAGAGGTSGEGGYPPPGSGVIHGAVANTSGGSGGGRADGGYGER